MGEKTLTPGMRIYLNTTYGKFNGDHIVQMTANYMMDFVIPNPFIPKPKAFNLREYVK